MRIITCKNRQRLNISARKNEEFVKEKIHKYATPNNMSYNLSFDKQSETTTKETNQYMSTKKMTNSIDRLRLRKKLISNHPLSGPTDTSEVHSNMKVTGKFSQMEIPSVSPKIRITKAIRSVNYQFGEAFKYSERDVELLSQHPLILNKVSNWGEDLSPEYLIELKKKQRQFGKHVLISLEYWKHRVKSDFQPAVDTLKRIQEEKSKRYMDYKS
jgi:glutamate synthase domain-containing protein 2